MPADHPSLAQGALHVWHAELDRLDGDVAKLLSHTERERAEHIVHARKRERWMRARGTLRVLLARYLAADPHSLVIVPGARGKPELASPGSTQPASTADPSGASVLGAPTLHFNVSRSGATALYAFTEVGPVGVDVELPRRPLDTLAVARRAFDDSAVRSLEALDEPARQCSFLHQWVRHEAALKCRGTGLTGMANARAETAAEPASGESAESDLWIEDLEIGRPGAAAVAVEGRPSQVCLLEVRRYRRAARPRKTS